MSSSGSISSASSASSGQPQAVACCRRTGRCSQVWASVDLLCQKRLNASSGSYSTVEALKNTDVPILLIHGEDDHFVPLKMAFENRDACAAPCKLLIVPGADHAMSYYMGRGAYEAAMRAFWEHFDK